MPVSERLVQAAKPIARAMRSIEDMQRDRRVDEAIDNAGNLRQLSNAFSKEWNGNRPLLLGDVHIWIGPDGPRWKTGRATSATDGALIGAGI